MIGILMAASLGLSGHSQGVEETLHCKDRSAAFASLTAHVPQIGDFHHAP